MCVPASRVRFELGDTSFPEAPNSGGSTSAASVSPAVQAACKALRNTIINTAIADPRSPLQGLKAEDIEIDDGWLQSNANKSRREEVAALAARQASPLSERGQAKPGDERSRYEAVRDQISAVLCAGQRSTLLAGQTPRQSFRLASDAPGHAPDQQPPRRWSSASGRRGSASPSDACDRHPANG